MITVKSLHKRRWRSMRLVWVVSVFAGWPVWTSADPPVDPLPAPLFSFARTSQQVMDGVVAADEMLGLGAPNLETVFMGWSFGLGLSADELDAHSVANAGLASSTSFALLFSVDGDTVGVIAPSPELVALGVPYNVSDQAQRGQVGGDQFLSTALLTLDGLVVIEWPNSVLIRNNFDEGGTDFDALPESSAEDLVVGQPQDRVDATTFVTSPTDAIYFSVATDSPSLAGMYGRPAPSGADVFVFSPPAMGSTVNPRLSATRGQGLQTSGPPCQAGCSCQASDVYDICIAQGGTVEACAAQAHEVLLTCLQTQCGIVPPPQPGLYGTAADFGLVQADDIDALIVFDADEDGVFNGTDHVLFSLSPESPSLSTIPGASAVAAAADVFLITPSNPAPVLFATAANLGLGNEADNIDALDFTICDDVTACATAHGIRSHQAVPTLSAWTMTVLGLLILLAGTVLVRRHEAFRS